MLNNQFPIANNSSNNNPQITVTTNEKGTQVVSARELHLFLNAGSNVNTWFKNQIERAMLLENEDFTRVQISETSGQTSNDYAISLSSAKEIAMLNGGEKGKQARLYFIECEKKSSVKPIDFSDPNAILQLAQNWKEEYDKRQAAEIKVAEQEIKLILQESKVEYHDQVLQSEDGVLTTVIAKELGWSAIKLNKKLVDLKIQYKAGETFVLHAKYHNKGYSKTKTSTHIDSAGNLHSTILLVWTEKGREFIHRTIKGILVTS